MYPTDLPLAEIKNVVDIIRTSQIAAKKESFAHDLWIIQGYAQARIIGDPGLGSLAISTQATEKDPLDVLEKLAADAESGQPQAQIAIDWVAILKWAIQLLIAELAK